MKNISLALLFAATSVCAQVDRAGNVIDDGADSVSLGDMFLGGLVMWVIYVIWKKFFG